MSGGFRTALDIAREINGSPEPQRDLFAPDGTRIKRDNVPARHGRGRPPGAQNLTTKKYARWLLSHAGDPLLPAMRVAALDILDEGTVKELARVWACDRIEAVDRWTRINQGVQPYVHQQQPRAIHLSPGDPQALDDDSEGLPLPELPPLPGDDARDITPYEPETDL